MNRDEVALRSSRYRGFVGLHGGRVWVEGRPGGGASFHVFVPGSGPRGATAGPEFVADGARAD